MARKDFAIFILSHGRADIMTTHNTLRTCGYTGEYYIVIDNQDDQAERYRSLYGDSRVIVFDKNAIGKVTDAGDNFDGMTAILWARNAVFDIARRLGFTYFQMLDDDFSGFLLKYMNKERTKIWNKPFKRYDDWVDIAINFLDDTGAVAVASAQGGDWIGGVTSGYIKRLVWRKCMNTFICRTDRPFKFFGRMNEDVSTYVLNGMRGVLMWSVMYLQVTQSETQSLSGGMSEEYKNSGTYVKSFYLVMYAPSAVHIGGIRQKNFRIHHNIEWNNTAVKIISPKYKKL